VPQRIAAPREIPFIEKLRIPNPGVEAAMGDGEEDASGPSEPVAAGSATPHKRGKSAEAYTAIVYFHGMGTPRRYEELSRLTDALDLFTQQQDEASVGRLRRQTVEYEPSRVEGEDDVAFVRVTRVVKRFGNKTWQEGVYRLYEGFWSPFAAGGVPPALVAWWLIRRLFSPFLILFRPWRAHQRLKLACLYKLSTDVSEARLANYQQQLEQHYRDLEGWPARRKYPRGTFGNFCALIADKHGANSNVGVALTGLARAWRRRFVRDQIKIVAISVAIALIIVAGSALTGLMAWELFTNSPKLAVDARDKLQGSEQLYWIGACLALIATVCATVFFGRHFLKNFLADVLFWTIRDEKDARFLRRRDMLAAGEGALLQVLRDPACKRIVIVAHSLGTAIAYECLLKLGRRKRARANQPDLPLELQRLGVISHFVTIGSPIDRIHYFFELHESRYHRYNRIADRLLGDTRDPPFTIDGKPGTVWINIWDDADIVSSRLFSPRGQLPNRNSIMDVKIRSAQGCNWFSAHASYFFAKDAIQIVFWITIFGRLPNRPVPQPSSRWANLILNRLRPAQRFTGIVGMLGFLPVAMLAAILILLMFDRDLSGWMPDHVLLAALLPLSILAVIFELFFVASTILGGIANMADVYWPLRIDRQARPRSD